MPRTSATRCGPDPLRAGHRIGEGALPERRQHLGEQLVAVADPAEQRGAVDAEIGRQLLHVQPFAGDEGVAGEPEGGQRVRAGVGLEHPRGRLALGPAGARADARTRRWPRDGRLTSRSVGPAMQQIKHVLHAGGSEAGASIVRRMQQDPPAVPAVPDERWRDALGQVANRSEAADPACAADRRTDVRPGLRVRAAVPVQRAVGRRRRTSGSPRPNTGDSTTCCRAASCRPASRRGGPAARTRS